MGFGSPKVVVSGPSKEELNQRQQQFEAQMAAQQEQSKLQLDALNQQAAQQAAIAEEQKKNLIAQLQAAGNANGSNYLQQLIQLLAGQTSSSLEVGNNSKNQQAQETATAVQQNRANTQQAKALENTQSLISQLNRSQRKYVN